MLDFDFEPQTPQWAKRLCVFDLETTGLDLREARIVTACVAIIGPNGEVEAEPTEWLINPGIEIPAVATSVHGVTTEIAQQNGIEPRIGISEINQALAAALDSGIPLLAFNAPYDFSILHFESIRNGLTPLEPRLVIDPLVLDRKLNKFRKGKRNLGVLCSEFGVNLLDAHNSTADAIAAGKLAQAMARKHSELNLEISQLHQLQIEWSKEQSLDFARFMQAKYPEYQAEIGWPVRIS